MFSQIKLKTLLILFTEEIRYVEDDREHENRNDRDENSGRLRSPEVVELPVVLGRGRDGDAAFERRHDGDVAAEFFEEKVVISIKADHATADLLIVCQKSGTV